MRQKKDERCTNLFGFTLLSCCRRHLGLDFFAWGLFRKSKGAKKPASSFLYLRGSGGVDFFEWRRG